jgi:hypothetical protein
MNMKLFGRKKKVNTPTNSINQPLDKLVNGELPFGWYAHNKHIIKPKEDRMVELALKTRTPDEEKRIAALQELIQYFYSYQAECQSMGECFAKYFDERYMHCMNSRCDDFVYITPYEQELNELKGNR